MENWPTSILEERLDQLSVAGVSNTLNDGYAQGSTKVSNSTTPIYCSTDKDFKTGVNKEIIPEKEGYRKITEKYDSVGKLRSSVARDRLGVDTRLGATSRMSDGASDISDPNPSSSSTVSSGNRSSESISEQDLLQVEMFFRSHKTEVHACQCLANLYFASGNDQKSGEQNWEFSATGIPLLILDTGEHIRKRRLQFVMAEKGTGFVLFKDVIDNLTKYSAPHANFHTMHVSTDHRKLAGLSFDDVSAASEFYSYLTALTNNPDDDLLNLSKKKKKKEKHKPKAKAYKAPKKAEISQPCCFVHVTKLERPQLAGYGDNASMGSAETLDDLSS